VIVNSCSDVHLDVTLDHKETRVVLGVLGLSAIDITHVSVTIVRYPLDTEKLHAKASETLRDASANSLELWPTGDV